MKFKKLIIGPVIALGLLASACGATINSQTAQVTAIPVTRGEISLTVNGNGKIAISNDASLAFLGGGKLEVLNVKEGDKVTKGEVLAKMDTSALEVSLSQAKLALDQSKLARTQAEAALTGAQFALDLVQAVIDIKDDMTAVQTQIDVSQANLAQANAMGDSAAATALNRNLASYNMQLLQDKKKLSDLLSKPQYTNNTTSTGTTLQNYYLYIGGQKYDRAVVEDARMKEQAVEVAQETLDKVKDTATQAQKNIDYIQKQINDSTIAAPFDGIAAKVYPKQGDIIPPPSLSQQVIVYIVDTNNLEADVNIDEMDLLSLQVGQKTNLSLDALPGKTISGKVISISTLANPQPSTTGSTTYTVKVGFTALADVPVKTGMSVTADIIVADHPNSVLVSSQAIKKDSQGKTYVEVMDNQQIKNQPVVVGLSDGSRTEILSGLSDNQKVVTRTGPGKWSLQGN